MLIFPEGSTPGTILRDNITIFEDDIVELNEDFGLSAFVTDPNDPATFIRDMATGLIIDEDSTSGIPKPIYVVMKNQLNYCF